MKFQIYSAQSSFADRPYVENKREIVWDLLRLLLTWCGLFLDIWQIDAAIPDEEAEGPAIWGYRAARADNAAPDCHGPCPMAGLMAGVFLRKRARALPRRPNTDRWTAEPNERRRQHSIAFEPPSGDDRVDDRDRDAGFRHHDRQCGIASARAEPRWRHRSRLLGHDELSLRLCCNGDADRLAASPLWCTATLHRRDRPVRLGLCALRDRAVRDFADSIPPRPRYGGRHHPAAGAGYPSRHLSEARPRSDARIVGSDDHGRPDIGPHSRRRHYRPRLVALDLRP